MIIPPGPLKVMVATKPVDFRKGAVSLAALVEHELGLKPFSGEGFELADCGSCMIARACGFTGVLNRALAAFMDVLDSYTLEDLVGSKSDMAAIFGSGMANAVHEQVIGDP